MTSATQARAPAVEPAATPRWDPLVRLTHWGIAAAIVLNGLVTEEGKGWHIWVGYAAGVLLVLRLGWGLIGTRSARFTSFPPNPAAALAHVRDILAGRHAPRVSHNPLGALMVYALWAALAVTVGTGIAMDQARPAARAGIVAVAEAGHDEEGEDQEREGEGESVFEEVHEVAANLLFLLAALHIAGVVFETRRSGGGLVRAMVTGRGDG
jgi:cytochrome b